MAGRVVNAGFNGPQPRCLTLWGNATLFDRGRVRERRRMFLTPSYLWAGEQRQDCTLGLFLPPLGASRGVLPYSRVHGPPLLRAARGINTEQLCDLCDVLSQAFAACLRATRGLNNRRSRVKLKSVDLPP